MVSVGISEFRDRFVIKYRSDRAYQNDSMPGWINVTLEGGTPQNISGLRSAASLNPRPA